MSGGFWIAIAIIIVGCMWFDVSIADTFWTIISFWWVPVIIFLIGLAILFFVIIIFAILGVLFD